MSVVRDIAILKYETLEGTVDDCNLYPHNIIKINIRFKVARYCNMFHIYIRPK